MFYTHTNIILRSEKPITLNSWTGSTLRGAISKALMKQDCREKNKNCKTCSKAQVCTNALLFNNKQNGSDITANPIVLNITQKCDGIKTNTIDFELILIGKGVLAQYSLIDTLNKGIKIYNPEDGTDVIFRLYKCGETITEEVKPKLLSSKGIRVEFESPTILKDSMQDLSPVSFMRAVLIRNKAVKGLVEQKPLDGYMSACDDMRDNVEVGTKSIKNVTQERKSITHGKMVRSGVVGYIEYKGDFTPYAEQLAVAEKFNIGKMCSMGSGKIKITPL